MFSTQISLIFFKVETGMYVTLYKGIKEVVLQNLTVNLDFGFEFSMKKFFNGYFKPLDCGHVRVLLCRIFSQMD